MEGRKAELLQWIERDRKILLDFFQRFIRCPSPNPPGDTREAADHIRRFLAQHGAGCRVIAPNEVMPNIVATFEAGKLGRHLALNGHIDCFPVGDGGGWTHDSWGGELVDGRIYGRGACDMKCGTYRRRCLVRRSCSMDNSNPTEEVHRANLDRDCTTPRPGRRNRNHLRSERSHPTANCPIDCAS